MKHTWIIYYKNICNKHFIKLIAKIFKEVLNVHKVLIFQRNFTCNMISQVFEEDTMTVIISFLQIRQSRINRKLKV